MEVEMRLLAWDRDYQEARLGKQLRDVHALPHTLKHSTSHFIFLFKQPKGPSVGRSRVGLGQSSLDRL